MLLMTKEHLRTRSNYDDDQDINDPNSTIIAKKIKIDPNVSQDSISYLTTSKRLRDFSNNNEPKVNDKIVYVDGGFDLFRKYFSSLHFHINY
jgi:ethanolamine-phosphate cytidylyltransferase